MLQYSDDGETWTDIMNMDELKGEKGDKGDKGDPGEAAEASGCGSAVNGMFAFAVAIPVIAGAAIIVNRKKKDK